jgi:hypothetical protein
VFSGHVTARTISTRGTISARRFFWRQRQKSCAEVVFTVRTSAQRITSWQRSVDNDTGCFSQGGRNAGAASRSGRDDEQGDMTAILRSGQQHYRIDLLLCHERGVQHGSTMLGTDCAASFRHCSRCGVPAVRSSAYRFHIHEFFVPAGALLQGAACHDRRACVRRLLQRR